MLSPSQNIEIDERLAALKRAETKDPAELMLNKIIEIIQNKIRTETLTQKQLIDVCGNDLSRLTKLAAVLIKNRVSTENENVIGYALTHMFDHQKNEKLAQEFFDFLKKIKSDRKASTELCEKINAKLRDGLVTLCRMQDLDQLYHGLLHSLEMRKDTAFLLAQLSHIPPFSELDHDVLIAMIKALAAYHDIIQKKGPFVNEQESSQKFCHDFEDLFEKVLGREALHHVSDKVIIEGTYLNFGCGPRPKHTALYKIICDVDCAVLETKPMLSQKVLHVLAGISSYMDVNRSNTLHSNVKLPEHMEAVVKAVLQTSDAKDLSLFLIIMGQNLRMMADGPHRKFKGEEMDLLKQAFEYARLASSGPDGLRIFENFIREHYDLFERKIREAIPSEISFGSAMDSREVLSVMQKYGYYDIADVFEQNMLFKDSLGRPQNAWSIHMGDVLLSAGNEIDFNFVTAMIFATANQEGLELLASDELSLRHLYQKCFALNLPEKLTPEQCKFAADIFMNLDLDSKVHELMEKSEFIQLIQYVKSKYEHLANLGHIDIEPLELNNDALKVELAKAKFLKEQAQGKIDLSSPGGVEQYRQLAEQLANIEVQQEKFKSETSRMDAATVDVRPGLD